MSDFQQGPGWWLASDGKWYPPQPQASPPVVRSGPGVLTAILVVFGILFLFGIGLAVVGAVVGQGDNDPSGDEAALGASRPIGASDERLLDEFFQLPKRWNAAAEPIVTNYLDPDVEAEMFVLEAEPQIVELQRIRARMVEVALALDDNGIQLRLRPLVENYGDKLAAVVALVEAVDAGDVEGEEAAATQLDASATEGRRLACELIEKLEPQLTLDQRRAAAAILDTC